MPKPKRKTGKRKGKIKLTQRARIIKKNDTTLVARQDTFPRMPAQMPRTTAPVFKVKIRKK